MVTQLKRYENVENENEYFGVYLYIFITKCIVYSWEYSYNP